MKDSMFSDDAYIDFSSGKKYPMEKVVRKKRLQKKLEREELLQLPSGTDFMVVQEYHDGEAAFKRCYNLDMLHDIRNNRAGCLQVMLLVFLLKGKRFPIARKNIDKSF